MFNEAQIRREVCDVGRRLWERGLIGACEGNISARIDADRLLCTPAGSSKGHLQPDDLVTIDLNGNPLDGKAPSSEIRLHVRAFQRRPDCQAVIHAHPLVAIALTVVGETIPDDVLPESLYVLGPVANVPFGFPGTDEVPDGIDPFLADHKTFLLSHHGAATLGCDVWDAYDRMETLERVATILMYAKTMGRVLPLPQSASDRLRQLALHGRLA